MSWVINKMPRVIVSKRGKKERKKVQENKKNPSEGAGTEGRKREEERRRKKKESGSDRLSHTLAGAVSWALEVLTAVFGMGTGVSPPAKPPDRKKRV